MAGLGVEQVLTPKWKMSKRKKKYIKQKMSASIILGTLAKKANNNFFLKKCKRNEVKWWAWRNANSQQDQADAMQEKKIPYGRSKKKRCKKLKKNTQIQ